MEHCHLSSWVELVERYEHLLSITPAMTLMSGTNTLDHITTIPDSNPDKERTELFLLLAKLPSLSLKPVPNPVHNPNHDPNEAVLALAKFCNPDPNPDFWCLGRVGLAVPTPWSQNNCTTFQSHKTNARVKLLTLSLIACCTPALPATAQMLLLYLVLPQRCRIQHPYVSQLRQNI